MEVYNVFSVSHTAVFSGEFGGCLGFLDGLQAENAEEVC